MNPRHEASILTSKNTSYGIDNIGKYFLVFTWFLGAYFLLKLAVQNVIQKLYYESTI